MMKLKQAEANTLSAGEVAIEVLSLYDRGIVPEAAFHISFVVKVGREYMQVTGWDIKTRKDGSQVMVVIAQDK